MMYIVADQTTIVSFFSPLVKFTSGGGTLTRLGKPCRGGLAWKSATLVYTRIHIAPFKAVLHLH